MGSVDSRVGAVQAHLFSDQLGDGQVSAAAVPHARALDRHLKVLEPGEVVGDLVRLAGDLLDGDLDDDGAHLDGDRD